MARITVLTSSYPRFPGDGAAPFVQSISEHMAEIGHDLVVVAPYDPAVRPEPGGRLAVQRFRYAPVRRWHIMGHAQAMDGDTRLKPAAYGLLPAFLLSELRTGLAAARRQPAQIVHAHWVVPNGLVGAWVARILRLPLAVSLHGSDAFVALHNPAFGAVARQVFRQAAVVTACSPDLRAAAIALGAAPDRVHLLPWGADPKRFRPDVPAMSRAVYGLDPEAIVLASLGRLVPKKGFDVLVHTLPALVAQEPRVHVVIGGSGPQRAELARLARELGVEDHLHLPGQVAWDQAPGFLAMADLFVLPSVRDAAGNMDGLPTVLLEAMATARPVVATDIAGVPLVLTHDVNGMLCRPGDANALAEAIGSLLRDPDRRARLGQAARGCVEDRFNWLAVAQALTALFQPVLPAGQTREGRS